MSGPTKVLLDTCAVIWLANRDVMAPAALDAIVSAGLAEGVLVSPVSAWEIGMLSRPRENRQAVLRFLPDAKTWFVRFMAGAGIGAAPFTPEVAIDASYLPGDLHGDPGDRMIIATARSQGLPVVTRDRRILAYAKAGHVAAIPC